MQVQIENQERHQAKSVPLTIKSTLEQVKAAVDKAFEPDIVLGVTDTGRIYSRSPRTRIGWRYMAAIRGIEHIDDAHKAATSAGIFATVETH